MFYAFIWLPVKIKYTTQNFWGGKKIHKATVRINKKKKKLYAFK